MPTSDTVRVRVGVIGTGFGRRVVAEVFASTDGCDVVEVVSPRDDRAVGALCARDDVQLVSVHSPPFLHAAHVRLALAAGHHVLCDKPFARDAGEAAELLAEAEAAGVLHFLNFEFRHHPARQRLAALVSDGAVGRVEHVHWLHQSAGTRQPLRPHGWLFSAAAGGGWIGAWASHAVDTVHWAFGEVEDVTGVRRLSIPERPDAEGLPRAVDVEDGLAATLTLTGGATVTLDSSFAAAADLPPRLVVLGSEGALEDIGDERLVLRRKDGTREESAVAAADGERHHGAMRRWAEVVRDAVHDDQQVKPSFADGVACDRVLDRLRALPLVRSAGAG